MPRRVSNPTVEQTPEFALTTHLVSVFFQVFAEQQKNAGVDAVLHSRLSIVALTQVVATIAVDVGMPQDKFLDVCRAQFEHAFAKAPRFG